MNHIQILKSIVPSRLHPYLGALRRRLRSLPVRTRAQWQHFLKDPALSDKDRELLNQVQSRISPGDGMYSGNGAHYFKVGLSAIHCIETAMIASGLASVGRILDLPCGHGRVLRFLVHRFPNARFTAADLDRKGVDFCVRTFGAEGIYSQVDLIKFSLDHRFDLIWCGSLITHLNATGIHNLLAFFVRHLLPNGLLVFTTHGERASQRMLNRKFDYGIAEEKISLLNDSYRKGGFGFALYPSAADYGIPLTTPDRFGFADHPSATDYGVSLTSPEWIRTETSKFGLSEVYFREHGWDDHQDVYGFVRPS